jgi:hypothetical protein
MEVGSISIIALAASPHNLKLALRDGDSQNHIKDEYYSVAGVHAAKTGTSARPWPRIEIA